MRVLFPALTLAFAGIAVAAALARVWVVALAAAALALWMGSLALAVLRKTAP